MKKVSIMIPVYNQAQYIEQCIDSVLAQNHPNLEVIISDDSTNDETEIIVNEKYFSDPRVGYFHNIPTLGRVGNYHKTLYERTNGDYVLNLDGDDWLIDDEYISKAVEILDTHKNVVCVMANKKKFYENTNIYVDEKQYNLTLKPIMTGQEYLYKYAVNKVSFSHMTTVYRRKEALKIGFYDKDIVLSDGESMFRLMCAHDIAFIPTVVGVWRGHSSNETAKQNDITDFTELFAIEDNVVDHCKKLNVSNMGSLSVEQWSTQMKLKRSYPFIFNYMTNLSLSKLFSFMRNVYVYDKKLFIDLIWGINHKAYSYIKRKFIRG